MPDIFKNIDDLEPLVLYNDKMEDCPFHYGGKLGMYVYAAKAGERHLRGGYRAGAAVAQRAGLTGGVHFDNEEDLRAFLREVRVYLAEEKEKAGPWEKFFLTGGGEVWSREHVGTRTPGGEPKAAAKVYPTTLSWWEWRVVGIEPASAAWVSGHELTIERAKAAADDALAEWYDDYSRPLKKAEWRMSRLYAGDTFLGQLLVTPTNVQFVPSMEGERLELGSPKDVYVQVLVNTIESQLQKAGYTLEA